MDASKSRGQEQHREGSAYIVVLHLPYQSYCTQES